MSKKIENDEPQNWGCPHTEMRTRHEEFKAAPESQGLNLFMAPSAPHYANSKSRIAFSKWADANPVTNVVQFIA